MLDITAALWLTYNVIANAARCVFLYWSNIVTYIRDIISNWRSDVYLQDSFSLLFLLCVIDETEVASVICT